MFSKIDLKWGYHQIELSPESRPVTTFATHMGLYQYKRLMFGINAAPEHHQRIIRYTLQDCDGVQNILDDIIVYGRSQEEHNLRLDKVLTKLKLVGLTANKEKTHFSWNLWVICYQIWELAHRRPTWRPYGKPRYQKMQRKYAVF